MKLPKTKTNATNGERDGHRLGQRQVVGDLVADLVVRHRQASGAHGHPVPRAVVALCQRRPAFRGHVVATQYVSSHQTGKPVLAHEPGPGRRWDRPVRSDSLDVGLASQVGRQPGPHGPSRRAVDARRALQQEDQVGVSLVEPLGEQSVSLRGRGARVGEAPG